MFAFYFSGLDPSGYRSSIVYKDENDALLGGEAQMSDEERFKVVFKKISWRNVNFTFVGGIL